MKLSDKQRAYIRASDLPTSALAERFGVAASLVWRIRQAAAAPQPSRNTAGTSQQQLQPDQPAPEGGRGCQAC
jgi:hypothetical protein